LDFSDSGSGNPDPWKNPIFMTDLFVSILDPQLKSQNLVKLDLRTP